MSRSDAYVDSSTEDPSFKDKVIDNMTFFASYFQTGPKTFFPASLLPKKGVGNLDAVTLASSYDEACCFSSDLKLSEVRSKIEMVRFALVFNEIVR